MFWDGFNLAVYLVVLFVLIFGEFRLGKFIVTEHRILKWFLIIIYTLGVTGIILRNV